MKKIGYTLLLSILASCTQKFVPAVRSLPSGYLVVEGIVNSGGGPTQITLSRTSTLNDSTKLYETGAKVEVEGTDSSVLGLAETAPGIYSASQLALDPSIQYRMRIATKDGRVYLSEFAVAINTPPIDSISWKPKNGGLQIYANTHDPLNNTHYYLWNYTETWEFHSPYLPELAYDTLPPYSPALPRNVIVIPAPVNFSIYTCWQTLSSTNLLLATSIGLSKDLIVDMPVEFIDLGSQKLSVEYSILVNQYALTSQAYQFLQEMKMNTEETGSIFDPQPSELNGNIHCLTNPAEEVIGYFSIASVQSTRIFISNSDLPSWGYRSPCELDTVAPPTTALMADASGLFPVTALAGGSAQGITSFTASLEYCVDCTLTGTNQKPSFWP